MENSTEKGCLITKKDLHKMCLRPWAIMCSWNYERQVHMGFMYGIAPISSEVYKDDEEERGEAYTCHMAPFNCTPQMTPFIMGLCASMEKQNAQAEEENFNTESISMIKTSLMGPFTGVGGSFFQDTLRIITFEIGLSLAEQGGILGPILTVGLFAIPSTLAVLYGGKLGYESGNKYLTKLYQEGLMDRVMQFASITSLAVVGGTVASVVPVVAPLEFTIGGTEFVLQDLPDSIIPELLSPVCISGIYKLTKKNAGTNILLLGCVSAGFALSMVGIL